ncbi:MAG: class II aldolase/adducin family protein [Rectinemataceae bacterium]
MAAGPVLEASTALELVAALSRRYGSKPAWVLAGGGNSSFKDASRLWVKASGTSLATIEPSGFCEMKRDALAAIWTKTYPAEASAREEAALADLMAARASGETRRPSVETLMHGFFPQAFVLHTHPALVNGLTCGKEGEAIFRELFADEAIWVPFVDPGYILAKTVRDAFEEWSRKKAAIPSIMFMQNHGLLVAADTPEGIDRLSESVISRLQGRLGRSPDSKAVAVDAGRLAAAVSGVAALAPAGSFIAQHADADILAFAASKEAFTPLSSAFTPDHIVYAGHEFLYASGPDALEGAWKDYRSRNGSDPRVLAVAGVGALAIASTQAAASTALALFQDATAIAVYSESFGGALHMTAGKIDFIRNWEVEKYRAKAAPQG